MVAVRFGRVDHRQQPRQVIVKQEFHQSGNSHTNHNSNSINMFKVPSSSASSHQFPSQHHHHQQQQQQQHTEMLAAAKRKWQDSANTTLGLTPAERPLQKQKMAAPPLTIFYAGSVNVYENVPENMVRALMTLAAAKSTKPGAAMLSHLQKASSKNNTNNVNSAHSYGFVNQPSTGFGLPAVQPHQAQNVNQLSNRNTNTGGGGGGACFSFPTSATPTTTATTREDTSLSLSSFKPEEKNPSPPPSTQPSSSAASAPPPSGDPSKINPMTKMQLLPPGLPQARRASIQRFLEKRKQKQVVEDGDSGKSSTTKSDVPHFLRL